MRHLLKLSSHNANRILAVIVTPVAASLLNLINWKTRLEVSIFRIV